MTEIINLRRARKAKARNDANKRANENRAYHGLSKPARDKINKDNAAAARFVEGHKLQKSHATSQEQDGGEQD